MKVAKRRKIVLDICGGTGSWSDPWKKSGYDVRLVTLPKYDVTRWREYPDLVEAIESGRVKVVLAAPPCTEFSKAKGNLPRDFRTAMTTVSACLEIIWECRMRGKIVWALENPVGYLRQFLGTPRYTFKQWQFGTQYVKDTDLWGYFEHPRPTVKEMPKSVVKQIGRRTHSQQWSAPKAPKKYKGQRLSRAAIRAITPPAFSKAFMHANSLLVSRAL